MTHTLEEYCQGLCYHIPTKQKVIKKRTQLHHLNKLISLARCSSYFKKKKHPDYNTSLRYLVAEQTFLNHITVLSQNN